MLGVWDDEVLRGSIPDTWDSISGMYRKMNDELEDEARNAKDLGLGDIKFPDLKEIELGDMGLGKIVDQLGAALNKMTLSDFVLDPSVAKEIDNCFIITNQCVNTKWQSLADLVESGVEAVQFGVGGQIMDLEAINNLVSSAQSMGGAVAAEANAIAAEVAQMVMEMADKDLKLTVDPLLLSQRIKALNDAVGERVGGTAKSISDATAEVRGIVDSWNIWAGFDSMNEGNWLGGQFGGLGAEFGEATSYANDTYWRIKRRKQLKKKGGGGGAGGVGPGDTDKVTVVDTKTTNIRDNIYDPDEFMSAWGASETEVKGIGQASGAIMAGEETLEIFEDYIEQKIADISGGYDVTPTGPVGHLETLNSILTERAIVAEQAAATYDDWSYGEQFGSGGGGGRGGVRNTSTSVMNISINTKSSVQDILSDLKRIQYMDDASFFNSVS